MAFIKISDSLIVNVDNIETIERKGKLSAEISMRNGQKHLAEIPFEILVKMIDQNKGDLKAVLESIDRNTQRYSG